MSDPNHEQEEDDLAINENEIVRVIDLDDGERGIVARLIDSFSTPGFSQLYPAIFYLRTKYHGV